MRLGYVHLLLSRDYFQCRDAAPGESQFIFDRVFAPEATQQQVYDASVAPIVDDVMLGYNGSVMAYGQTGAGKCAQRLLPDNSVADKTWHDPLALTSLCMAEDQATSSPIHATPM